MASCDEDRLRIKPGAPKRPDGSQSGQRAQRFVSQVLKQVSKAGAKTSGARGARPASTFGRGRVASGMAGRTLQADARRVIIKSRFVVLKKAGANAVSAHLRYIERDGVTRDGQRGQAYGAETDSADLKAFEERGKGDRHQFRFIVSVDDAGELEDLRGYTREFMQRMTTDMETRLDWVAVDHWDTDNPHTHIVLRGRAGDGRGKGQDLVIAPDYMAHGMRMRASELATEWLGPRTELDIRQGQLREVEQERLTSLDRTLLRQASTDIVDLTHQPNDRQRQTVLRARLQRLEAMELAGRIDANHWRLSPSMQQTLTTMGERGDILRTMQRAMGGARREFVVFVPAENARHVVGRVAAKGMADELHDCGYLVVDGTDGKAHYVALGAKVELEQYPVGSVVEVRGSADIRAADKNIAALAVDGLYRTDHHLAMAKAQATPERDPKDVVNAHMRRLEALRRAGIVERVADGVWRVPANLPEQGRRYDAQRLGGAAVELRSHLPIERQTRVIGATWLDQQLIGGTGGIANNGFGGDVREALRQRSDFLLEQGLAERRGQRLILARNLLGTLRGREIDGAAKTIAAETGLTHRTVADGERVTGIYRRNVQLASGRFAMLDDGVGFSLVPWRPVVEQRLGQQVSAIVRGTSVTWELGRQRGR